MGDRYGHRACIVVYGAIYSLSCATMHSGDFWLLMFGRVCGGVAYSLLYSSCAPTPPPALRWDATSCRKQLHSLSNHRLSPFSVLPHQRAGQRTLTPSLAVGG